MTDDTGVRIEATRCCEVVIRGGREIPVLDALAGWASEHQDDGLWIVGLQWRQEWVPDPEPVHLSDQVPEYVVTMQFKTGVQQQPRWRT